MQHNVFYIIYETKCIITGNVYVGKHKQTGLEFDGYLGSGLKLRRSIEKYGVENFVRKTLHVFECEKEAYAKEAEIVNTDFVKRRDTLNLMNGGWGIPRSEATNVKISETLMGQKHTKERRKNISKGQKGLRWYYDPETLIAIRTKNPPENFVPGSKPSKVRIKAPKRKRRPMSEIGRKNIGDAQRGKSRGPFSDEIKRKMSIRARVSVLNVITGESFSSAHLAGKSIGMSKVTFNRHYSAGKLPYFQKYKECHHVRASLNN